MMMMMMIIKKNAFTAQLEIALKTSRRWAFLRQRNGKKHSPTTLASSNGHFDTPCLSTTRGEAIALTVDTRAACPPPPLRSQAVGGSVLRRIRDAGRQVEKMSYD